MPFFYVSSSFSEPTVRSLVYRQRALTIFNTASPTHTPLYTLLLYGANFLSPTHANKQPHHSEAHKQATRSCPFFCFGEAAREKTSQVLQFSSDDTTKALTSFLHVSCNLICHFCKGFSVFYQIGDYGGISWRRLLEGSTFFFEDFGWERASVGICISAGHKPVDGYWTRLAEAAAQCTLANSAGTV